MFLKQYYLGCLSHASYMVADESSGIAIVVDPQRDVEQYVEEAAARGFRIDHVLLTHFHADFLAGHLELRDRGATIHIGARGETEYEATPMTESEGLQLGDEVRLEFLETPGHTPESVTIVIYDRKQSDEQPHAILTGDTLFIGDVGRPDLMASVGVTADELAGMLYDSLHEKILPLPDGTIVYPAHGAGSMCGKALSQETSSPLGVQKKYNYALQPMTRERFIELVTEDQPDAPDYFSYDADLNRRERATLDESLMRSLEALTLEETLAEKERGAQLIDIRDPGDYASAHLEGSINIGLGGSFATWAGTLLDPTVPIVLIATPGQEREGAVRLGRVGFDNVAGFLDRGMEALEGHDDLLRSTIRITAPTVQEHLEGEEPTLVIDVRGPGEFETSRVGGAVNIPLNHLEERISEIPEGRPVVVHCRSGYRSSIAASVMRRVGFEGPIMDMVGGFLAWQGSGLPVEV